MPQVNDIVFTVPFVKGQSRPRFIGKPFPHAYKPEADRKAEEEIRTAARERAGLSLNSPALFGNDPVGVHVTCYKPLPGSRPKSCTAEPFKVKPDADNIAKLVLDALNGVLWRDDAQVTDLHVVKTNRTRLFDEPQTSIRVFKL